MTVAGAAARAVILAGLVAVLPALSAAQRWTLDEATRARIDSTFSFVGRDEPGCALGVVRDGLPVYARGYGLANLDWRIPITTSTVFDIGSVSKQFTATAIALLEADGVLGIDDDVRAWIPEMPDYGTPITLRHLLNHTSGVRDYLTLARLAGIDFDNVFDEFDGVELITRQEGLNFEPGSRYLYSNSGYLLLANVVRRATGASLRAFLEARVFDPLGMAHTSIWDDNTEILAERATGYAPRPASGGGAPSWRIDHAWNFQMGGDGQVITSVEDLMRWDANFYDPVVGGPALLDRLHTRGVLNDGDTIAYALGLVVDEYRGLRRVSHGGAWAGFRAALNRFPDVHASVIVLCNRADAAPSQAADRIADAVLDSVFGAAAAPPARAAAPAPLPSAATEVDPAVLAPWTGLYRHDEDPQYLRLRLRGDTLELVTAGPATAMRPAMVSAAAGPAPQDSLVFTADGRAVVLRREDGEAWVRVGGGSFRRVEADAPTPAELRALAGVYYSPELDVTYHVVAVPGRLAVDLPDGSSLTLSPGVPGEFFGPGVSAVFTREGERITGLRVFAGRVRDIRFERRGG